MRYRALSHAWAFCPYMLGRDGLCRLLGITQMSIDREHIGMARPLDEVVLECERSLELEYERTEPARRHELSKLVDTGNGLWREPFAFRGQSRQFRLKALSPSHGVMELISLHASEFRFVHELDWTQPWWDERGQAIRDEVNRQLNRDHDKLKRWSWHLMQHPLCGDYMRGLLHDYTDRLKKSGHIAFWSKPFVTPDEDKAYREFEAVASSRFVAVEGSLGQHYGLKSRFLDLSFSPRVAAWFALQDNWHAAVKGSRVYGYILRCFLPLLAGRILDYRMSWPPVPPMIVDISMIPSTIVKRPSLQHGLSLTNSPAPVYSAHLVGSGFIECIPFFTRPSPVLDDILNLDLYPKDDPFLEVVGAFSELDSN